MEPPPQDPHSGGLSRGHGQAGGRVVPDVPGTAASVPNGQNLVPPEWLQQQALGFGQPTGMSMEQMLFLMQMQQQMPINNMAFMGLQPSGMPPNQASAIMNMVQQNMVQQNMAFNAGIPVQPQNLPQGFNFDPAQVYRLAQARQTLTQVQAAQHALAAQFRAQLQAQAQAQAQAALAHAQSRNLAHMQSEAAAANMRSQATAQMIIPEAEAVAREAAVSSQLPPAVVLCEPQPVRAPHSQATEQRHLPGYAAQDPHGAVQDDYAKFSHPKAQQARQVETGDERPPVSAYDAGVGHGEDQVRSEPDPPATLQPHPGSGRNPAPQSGYPVVGGRPVDEVMRPREVAAAQGEPSPRLGGSLGREGGRGHEGGERTLKAAGQEYPLRERESHAGQGHTGPSPRRSQQSWRAAGPGQGEWRADNSWDRATASHALPDQEHRQHGSVAPYVEGHSVGGSHQSAEPRKRTGAWDLDQRGAFRGTGRESYVERFAGQEGFLRDSPGESFFDDGAVPLQQEGSDAEMEFVQPIRRDATAERSTLGDRRCLKRPRLDGDTRPREVADEVARPRSMLAAKHQQRMEREAPFEHLGANLLAGGTSLPKQEVPFQDDSATSTDGEREDLLRASSGFAVPRNPSSWVQPSSAHGRAHDNHASAPLGRHEYETSFQPPKPKCVPQLAFP